MKKTMGKLANIILAALTAFTVAPTAAMAESVVLTYQGGNGYVWDQTTTLSVAKLDQYHNYVEGATLAILDAQSGQTIVAWTTTASSVTFDRYFDGATPLNVEQTYILRELASPAGYAKAADVVFYLDQNGSVVIVDGGFVQGVLNAESVGGSTLNYYDTKDAQVVVEYVYQTNQGSGDSAAASVSGEGRMSPQTGDDAPLALVGGVAITCFVLIVVLQVAKRRLAKNQSSTEEDR